jgi:eukaryotic-like serine/threonine-protein kinase
LQAAHDLVAEDGEPLGVVHRDVSPQNVLIAANGQVRITDFGVAKARGQLHAPTQTGEVKGKIAYMAPEQVTTKDIDRRVDVFAIACVLYEATVGQRPFHGGDALSTLYQLLEEPIVPPSARAPGYPPELEAIVLKAMERDREQRYPSAAEFGRALERWLISEKATVTDADVAATLRNGMGEHVEALHAKIENAILAIESGKADSLPPPEDEPVTLVGPSATPQGGRTLGGASLPDIATKRARPGIVLAIGVALAIAAAAAFLLGRPAAVPEKPAEPVAHQKPPEPPATATTTGLAAGANVTPVASSEPATPPSATAEPSGKSSATPASTKGTHRVPGHATTVPITTAQPTSSGATTLHPSGDPTARPPKKPRSLDNENPFSSQ